MPTEVILPKVDMDMATGRIGRWYVEEGARIARGDVLFEIETDKAAMEIDAPVGGIIRQITGREGEDLPVGSRVAWIYEEGEAVASPSVEAAAAPVAAAPAPADRPSPAAPPPPASDEAGKVRATPLARRISRESNVDLAQVRGSGPQGRIRRADVEAFAATQAPATASPLAPAEPTAAPSFAEGSYDLVAHDGMRRTIARRLTESKSTVPHFYLTADAEIDELLALRAKINTAAERDGGADFRISVNDMVIKALALGLRAVPDANVSWTEAAMLRHRQVDIGVAVSVPGGLITPVVREADRKSLSALSREMKDLALRARERRLRPEEYQGGATAVSNLGMYGVREFAAIINPPQASILAVGAGVRRLVLREDDTAVPATVMTLTLSCDHRAIDGALGAQLLAAVRRYLENPLLMVA